MSTSMPWRTTAGAARANTTHRLSSRSCSRRRARALRLLAHPTVKCGPGIVAGRHGFWSLQRVVDLKVIAGLFVEVIDQYGDARFRIIGSHVVIHRDRCRRRPGIRWDVERLED